jgi:hypothetical protein
VYDGLSRFMRDILKGCDNTLTVYVDAVARMGGLKPTAQA